MITAKSALLHLTHYDPMWYKTKETETKPDVQFICEMLDNMKSQEFDYLILDCADAIEYDTHPELKRNYSISKKEVETIVNKANANNIDIIPKLNFSRSYLHKHNEWFRPYNELFDTDEYWDHAFKLIDELIDILQPKKFFHIGMDEDHNRSSKIYLDAILKLRAHLQKRGLKTIMWNDMGINHRAGEVFVEKINNVIDDIPEDVIQIVWQYSEVNVEILERLIKKDFEVWLAPANNSDLIYQWKSKCSDCEFGVVFTLWKPVNKNNRELYENKFRIFSEAINR